MESRTATATTATAATIDTTSSRAKHILVITGGDTYVGHYIASYLLRMTEKDGRDRHDKCAIRVLCRHEKNCDDLRDLGAEVMEIDYEDRKCLRQAFRDCEYSIFLPEMTRNRVHHGCNVVEAMKKEDVRHVLMLSMVGAETENRDLRHLHEFRELEKYLADEITRGRWCIFRLDFLQQLFLLWAPMIQDEHRLKMSTGRDGCFAPVNLSDVSRAIHVLLTRHHHDADQDRDRDGRRDRDDNRAQVQPQVQPQTQRDPQSFRWAPLDKRHHRRTYYLTGREAVDGESIARILGDAIGERDVKFDDVSRSEMRRELEKLRDEDGKHGRRDVQQSQQSQKRQQVQQQGQQSLLARAAGAVAQAVLGTGGQERRNAGDERRGDERRGDDKRDRDDGRDRDGRFRHRKPLKRHLNETKIETLLDFFEYVKKGGADFVSDDLAKIIDEEPESLEQFFRHHRDEFRGDDDRRGRNKDEQVRQTN